MQSLSRSVPGMEVDQEVKVFSEPGQRNRSEPQGWEGDLSSEGSGERSRGPTNRNRIRGVVVEDERASDREVLLAKGRRRKSGGGAVKVYLLTRGGLVLCLKGRRRFERRSEKSAEAILVVDVSRR